ncbi:MAG: helix-turn-helix transcriptional regulator [Candidatus Faecousia sp.]|nr:helix-turn-helix transcriptional regulator [Candidatus Faecousia sp.]
MANKEWLKKGADGLSFGERLGDLIANNRTTATALARDTGLSQSAISDYLNKDRAPDCAAVCALARYFSVSADYLLGIDPSPAADQRVRDMHRHTGLSEENITRLMAMALLPTSFPYADFANACLDTVFDSLENFVLLERSGESRTEYEKSKPHGGSDTPLSGEKCWEERLAIDAARTQAEALGCKLMTYEDSIRFYAREIANKLERNLLRMYGGD